MPDAIATPSRASSGFDPSLKFDDIELIRRLSEGRRFGIIEEVSVSDRRYKEGGFVRTVVRCGLTALFFALGRYRWANAIDCEIGVHGEREGRVMLRGGGRVPQR